MKFVFNLYFTRLRNTLLFNGYYIMVFKKLINILRIRLAYIILKMVYPAERIFCKTFFLIKGIFVLCIFEFLPSIMGS